MSNALRGGFRTDKNEENESDETVKEGIKICGNDEKYETNDGVESCENILRYKESGSILRYYWIVNITKPERDCGTTLLEQKKIIKRIAKKENLTSYLEWLQLP